MTEPERAKDSPESMMDWGGSQPGPVVSGAPWSDENAEDPGDPWASATAVARPKRYELRGELGRGGMGQVLVAHDHLLGRDVALKRLIPGQPAREETLRRLAREARITGVLEHPAIVPVLDAGTDEDGAPFYVMRLIRGRTFADAAAKAPDMSGRLRLLRHFLHACEAVGYAHSKGVVHRDLKPDNILVGEFGETLVADWGLARTLDSDESALEPSNAGAASQLLIDDATHTRDGAIVGTPAFMSPEQARGEPAQRHSDVFSLGVVLWQLIAGRHPLAGKSSEEVLQHVRTRELPSPTDDLAEAPAELVAIAQRATALQPHDRYPNGKALADDVARYLDGGRVRAHDYSPTELLQRLVSVWRAPLIVAAVALAVLFIGGGVAFNRTAQQRDRAVAAEAEAVTAHRDADRNLAESLAQHAVAAMAREHRARAETLAAASVVSADNPEARGVLAGFAVAPRAVRLKPITLPKCRKLRPNPSGDAFACTAADHWSVWRYNGTRFESTWRRDAFAADAHIVPGFQRAIAVGEQEYSIFNLDAPQTKPRVHRFGLQGIIGMTNTSRQVVLWNAGAAQLLAPKPSIQSPFAQCRQHVPMSAVAATQDGDTVALFCDDNNLKTHNFLSGDNRSVPANFGRFQGPTNALWLPESATLLVGTRDGTVAEVDSVTGALSPISRFPGGQVATMALHPAGRWVAVQSGAAGVLVWDRHNGVVLAQVPATNIRAIRWRKDGKVLWIFGDALTRWRLPETPRSVRFWSGPLRAGLSTTTTSPDGKHLVLLPGSGEVRVHNVDNGQLVLADKFQTRVLKGCVFSHDGRTMAVWAAGAPSLRLYETRGWTPTATVSASGLKRVVWLRNGWLVIAPYSVGLYAIHQQRPHAAPKRFGTGVFMDADIDEARDRALFVNNRNELWEVTGDPPKARIIGQKDGLKRVALSGDGRVYATLERGEVKVWDAAGDGLLATLQAVEGATYGIALDRTGKYVAAGHRDGSVHVWNVPGRRLEGVLRGHFKRVADVAFDNVQGRLVTASWDGSARLWDLATLAHPAGGLQQGVNAAWGLTVPDALRSRR